MTSYVSALWTRLGHARTAMSPPALPKNADALKIGILGAADITPLSLIRPAQSHPGIVVYAVAARDRKRAEAFASKWSIPRVFDSYDDLISCPDIDCIYNPLPNGLHSAWTLKAIQAGKHVLLEKPSGANAEDAASIFDAAKKANVVCLEAIHPAFHPARHEFAYQLGKIVNPQNPLKRASSSFCVPAGALPKGDDDIRFNFSLAGGIMMDMGVYAVQSGLWPLLIAGGTLNRAQWWEGIEIESAEHELFEPAGEQGKKQVLDPATGKNAIDRSMHAVIRMPTARNEKLPVDIRADMGYGLPVPLLPSSVPLLGRLKLPYFEWPTLTATTKDGSTVVLHNHLVPNFFHSIVVTRRGRTAAEAGVAEGSQETIKAYVPRAESAGTDFMKRGSKNGHWPVGTGEEWWTTYRWQLEAFVLAVQNVKAGRAEADDEDQSKLAPVWLPSRQSKVYAQVIDQIYAKSGLPKRQPTVV
ncbi:hypothetical protein OC834_004127 [Tilletia horrida]|nr:hypothetical protein OC834_004127 [Tilletia horrida]KAK0559502.1 hypothetical protein OC844_004360 [Tilletia horrida]